MFDVLSSEQRRIAAFDISLNGAGSSTVEIWHRMGTYVGRESSVTGWTQLGSQSISGAAGVPIRVNVGGLVLQPGQTYGILVYSASIDLRYTNGQSPGTDHRLSRSLSVLTAHTSSLSDTFVSNPLTITTGIAYPSWSASDGVLTLTLLVV